MGASVPTMRECAHAQTSRPAGAANGAGAARRVTAACAARPRLRKFGGVALLVVGLAGALVALVGLASAAHKAPWAALLASPVIVGLMLSAMVGGYLMQSCSLAALVPGRLARRDWLLLPWGCAAINRVTPGGAGGLWLTTRVLRSRSVSCAGAGVFLASVGVAHTLGGLTLLAGAVAFGGAAGPHGLPLGGPGWLLPLVGVLFILLLVGIPRTRSRGLALLRQARHEVSLRRLPALVFFQACSRFAPAFILYVALHGLHHPLPLSTVVALVVVASATGSALPLPSGAGGVEMALTGLLAASGLPLGAASAGVLVARLIGFWLPAAIGLPALLALRRSLGLSGHLAEPVPLVTAVPAHGSEHGPWLVPIPAIAAA